MDRTPYVLITDDIYNELEDYALDALQGDSAALKSLTGYAKELGKIADSLEDKEAQEYISPALDWIRRGAMVEDFELSDGEYDDEGFGQEVLGPIEVATQLFGELMVPVDEHGYHPQMDLGRLDADQLPAYSETRPQATLGSIRYSFVDLEG